MTPPYTNFGAIGEQVAENGGLRITLISPELNKVETSALRRLIENPICYRMVVLQGKIASKSEL